MDLARDTLWPLVGPLEWLLDGAERSIGLAVGIVMLTLAMRLALFPVAYRQARAASLAITLGPRVSEIYHAHPDVESRRAALLELYRAEGVHPFSGVLLALAQLPFFACLFVALSYSTRHSSGEVLGLGAIAAPAGDSLGGWLLGLAYLVFLELTILLSLRRGVQTRNWLNTAVMAVLPVTILVACTYLSLGMVIALAVSGAVSLVQAILWLRWFPVERGAQPTLL